MKVRKALFIGMATQAMITGSLSYFGLITLSAEQQFVAGVTFVIIAIIV